MRCTGTINHANIPNAHLVYGNPQHAGTTQTEYTRWGSPALTLPGTFAGRAVTSQDQTAQLVQEVIIFIVQKPINAFTQI